MSSSSNPTVKSLQIQVNELTQKLAALTQQVAAMNVTPVAAETGKKARKPKKEKDPDAPKRPPTAFFAYSAAQRAAHTGDKKLTAKDLGETWKLLSDEQKAVYKPSSAPASDAEDDAE